MSIKKIFTILICISFLAIGVLLASCSETIVSISKIEMKDSKPLEVEIGSFDYKDKYIVVHYSDGTKSEKPLEESMISDVEKIKFYKEGEQSVLVSYGIFSCTMVVVVKSHEFENVYTMNDETIVYDGLPHRITIKEELPEGATVVYPNNNIFTDVGVYKCVAKISKENYNDKIIEATITIVKSDYDMSRLSFNDKEITFDGTEKKIEIENLPENLEVTYNIFDAETGTPVYKAINVGKYKFVAHINNSNQNYNPIPDMEAYLTITKADYDMSGVKMEDITKTFDDKNCDFSITEDSVLPLGVTVSYECRNAETDEVVTSNKNCGTYKIIAKFKGDENNYNKIPVIERTLVVEKEVIKISDKVVFDSLNLPYDGNNHSLLVSGIDDEINSGKVEVEYENNEQKYAGTYEIFATFICSNGNFTIDVDRLVAILMIEKTETTLDIKPDDIVIETDQNGNKYVTVTNIPSDVEVISAFLFKDGETKDPNNLEEGIYNYEVHFRYKDENVAKSVTITPATGNYTYTV